MERARRVRESAAVAVSGVVASLSLAVALTVMVASFRNSVTDWLDTVLPAALYVRTATNGSAADTAYFDPAYVRAAAQLPGVERISTQRTVQLSMDAAKPAVALLVRPLHDARTGTLALPLVGAAVPVPAGRVGVYVSEAMVDLYGARIGQDWPQFSQTFKPLTDLTPPPPAPFFVAGIWRDYARQFGTVAMEQADFARYSSDTRVNDIAFWLTPQTEAAQVEAQLRDLANQLAPTPEGAASALLERGMTILIIGCTLLRIGQA